MFEDLVHAPETIGEIVNALVSMDGVLEVADIDTGSDEGGQELTGIIDIDQGADDGLVIGIFLVKKILANFDEMSESIIVLVLPKDMTFGGVVRFVAQFEQSARMLGDNEVTAGPVIVVVAGKTGIIDDHSP